LHYCPEERARTPAANVCGTKRQGCARGSFELDFECFNLSQ
jgi:hypothetical protein